MARKQKYTNKDIVNEIRRVHKDLGRIPYEKEWKNLSMINSSTISRRFGTWKKAFVAAGFSADEQTKRNTKIKIIEDFRKAYESHKDSNISSNIELIKLSGHREGVIYKYFGSVDAFIDAAKVSADRIITNDQIMDDFIQISKMVNRRPTKKDIRAYGKFRLFLYSSRFGGLAQLHEQSRINFENKTSISEQELLDNLKKIYKDTDKVPTNKIINEIGKFSSNAYRRKFGSFSNALNKIGLSPSHGEFVSTKCPICNKDVKKHIVHIKVCHPQELKKYEEHVIALFRSGLSNRKIAAMEDVVYNSPSAVNRVVDKYISKDEKDKLRKEKISSTLSEKYDSGSLNWVSDININKNTDENINAKISASLKKSYDAGVKTAWNKGKDKSNSQTIRESAKKSSETMEKIYNTGQLERKYTCSVKRYRLGAGFSSSDRRKIKQRAKYMCQICKVSQEELEEMGKFLECDHILSIGNGVADNWEANGQALCPSCHKNKALGVSYDNIKYEARIQTNIKCGLNSILQFDKKYLTKDAVRKMSYSERYDLSHYLLDFFINYDFGTLKYNKSILNEFEVLKNTEYDVHDKQVNSSNNNSVKICKYYCPNIIKLRNERWPSVYSVLNDREKLLKVIMNRLGGMGYQNFSEYFNITPALMLRGAKVSGFAAPGSIFKPAAAKAIYSHWVKDGDTVYDYSAGFCGRLLGFHASGKQAKYIGAEPNTETYKGLLSVVKDFGINAQIYNTPSEDLLLNEPINFAFSSPPYFDHEIYCDEDTQSYNRFSKYEDWLEYYWGKTIDNIKLSLAPDGVLGVNAGNFANDKMKKIYRDMNAIVENKGFEIVDTWYLKSNSKQQKEKLEPINFYRRIV